MCLRIYLVHLMYQLCTVGSGTAGVTAGCADSTPYTAPVCV